MRELAVFLAKPGNRTYPAWGGGRRAPLLPPAASARKICEKIIFLEGIVNPAENYLKRDNLDSCFARFDLRTCNL